MSALTLELVKSLQAKQADMAALLAKLCPEAETTLVRIPAIEIELQSGEWYAGAVLNEDGSIKHHLIAAAVHEESLDFDAVQAWAEGQGYSAPTKQECRLLVAHHHGRLGHLSWMWTCEKHENASCAWRCLLGYGYVLSSSRSAAGGAVAVRRVNP